MLGLVAVLAGLSLLPGAESMATIGLGEECTVTLDGGEGWFRILEDDYVFLRISSDEPVSMTAFDSDETVLGQSNPGHDLILSAYGDYWFYIRLTGRSGGSATVSVLEEAPGPLPAGTAVQGSLALDTMGGSYRFVTPSDGRWTFDLEGSGSMDLDLEVYGPGMDMWAGGYSTESSESVSCAALRGDTLMVVVSRFNKAGSGNYSLTARRTGDFPVLEGSAVGTLDAGAATARFRLEPLDGWALLRLASPSEDGDIDLLVRDRNGEVLWNSSSYSTSEALLVPPRTADLVAEVKAYDFGDSDRIRFQLGLLPSSPVRASATLDTLVQVSNDRQTLIAVRPPSAGLYAISAVFEKLRDGDLQIFRGSGPSTATMGTARGDESFVAWIGQGDTLYLHPAFGDISTSGSCRLSMAPFGGPALSGTLQGSVSASTPVASWSLGTPGDAVVSIRLRGADRETDLDMIVSGPGMDRMAQGWISSADAAGDEEITFYSPDPAVLGISVYTYERTASGSFSLGATSIPRTGLAAPGPEGETWALLAGISGYPSSADALNRAGMDALDFYRFLSEEMGVPADHIVLLVDEMATAAAFRTTFQDLIGRAGEGDKVLVFFSGHGDQLPPGSGGREEGDSANEAICLYDGEIEDDWIASALSGEHAPVILFMDACFSGGLVNDFGRGSNTMILTAAREDRSVSERVLTPILLRGAEGEADGNRDGSVTARELLDFVDSRLQLICPVCDAVITAGSAVCPDCGSVLKGENRVPRPEQGFFLDEDIILWSSGRGGHGGR